MKRVRTMYDKIIKRILRIQTHDTFVKTYE